MDKYTYRAIMLVINRWLGRLRFCIIQLLVPFLNKTSVSWVKVSHNRRSYSKLFLNPTSFLNVILPWAVSLGLYVKVGDSPDCKMSQKGLYFISKMAAHFQTIFYSEERNVHSQWGSRYCPRTSASLFQRGSFVPI